MLNRKIYVIKIDILENIFYNFLDNYSFVVIIKIEEIKFSNISSI